MPTRPPTTDPIAPSVKPAVERLAYSPGELAAAIGVSRNTIHNWIAAGQLRTVKLGRRRLIPASEWDRLVAEGLA